MKARSILAVIVILAVGALVATEALAQVEVAVQNKSFAWTGKSGPDAGYRWSATINNPSRRELNLRVTIELLNAAGDVVSYDSADVVLQKEDSASVEQTASVAVATAQTATQYRVVLVEIE